MSSRLEELLDLLCDGQMGAAQMAELERIVLSDPQAMARMVQTLQLDGQLRWEFGAGAEPEQATPATTKPVRVETAPRSFGLSVSRPFAAAAGLILFFGLLSLLWMGLGQPDRPAVDLVKLEKAMAHENGLRREVAVARFAQFAAPEQSHKVARLLAEDRSPFVRAAAARGLGWMVAYEQKQLLLEALRDESKMVRHAAIDAIDRIAGVRIVTHSEAWIRNRRDVIAMLEQRWPKQRPVRAGG